MQIPLNDRPVLTHVAQSELLYATANKCIMIRSIAEKKIMVVASDRWQGTFWEVESRTSPPRIDPISLSHVKVANGVFQSVVVVFGRGRVRL